MLSAAAPYVPQPGKGGLDEAHSGAIVGVTPGTLAAAAVSALAGTMAGVQAKAAGEMRGRPGPACLRAPGQPPRNGGDDYRPSPPSATMRARGRPAPVSPSPAAKRAR